MERSALYIDNENIDQPNSYWPALPQISGRGSYALDSKSACKGMYIKVSKLFPEIKSGWITIN